MGITLAGGTNINHSAAPASASALVDMLETYLANAGWTVTSGAGTDAITFTSATTGNGFSCRLITSVSGTVVRLKLDNSAGTSTPSNYGGLLDVDGVSTWHLIANRYGFVIFQAGAAGSARKFAICSNLSVDSSLESVTTSSAFLMSDCQNANGTSRESFRDSTCPEFMMACHLLWNGTVTEFNNFNTGDYPAIPLLYIPYGYGLGNNAGSSAAPDFQWPDGSYPVHSAIVQFGVPNNSSRPDLRGEMFDVCVVMGKAFAELDEFSYDGNTYIVFGSASSQTVGEGRSAASLGFLKPAA